MNEEVTEQLKKMIDKFGEIDPELVPEFSEETIETLYTCGFAFFRNGHYDDAIHFFRFLTVIDVQNPRNWMGLAGSHKMLKEYEPAIYAYGFAALLDENNSEAHFHASECFRFLGDSENAKKALNAAERCMSKKVVKI